MSDGTVAALVVLGMVIGLIVPMHIFAAFLTAQER